MSTEKQEAEILETCRERYADSLQTGAYLHMADMNDVFDWYCIEHCLSDDDAEDAYHLFEIEFDAGQYGQFTAMHKTVSDLCYKRAQMETNTEWLKNEFYHSHKYN